MERMKDFLRLLREMQKIDPEFPLQYAVCLTIISMNEGLSVSTLADKSGLSLSTVSRIVGALSQSRQKGGEPYGLVRVEISAIERRRKEIYLTAKGRAFIHTMGEFFPALDQSHRQFSGSPKGRIATAL
jgi:DNA-binding MarR family transcriptional regulator